VDPVDPDPEHWMNPFQVFKLLSDFDEGANSTSLKGLSLKFYDFFARKIIKWLKCLLNAQAWSRVKAARWMSESLG
jgi:hypothetical protein